MSSLRDRLYNYQTPPPAHTWEQVAAALDEAELSSQFPARLQEMEAIPPAGIWEKISDSLENEEEGPIVVPMRKRANSFIRYAVAALFIGAVSVVIVRLSDGTRETGTATTEPASTAATGNSDTNRAATEPSGTLAGKQAQTDNVNVSQALAVRSEQPARVNRAASRSASIQVGAPLATSEADFSKAIYTYNDHVPTIAERYITLMTPEGGFIRMAKKWSNLLCCVSGEDQDAGCKDQLKKWQEKIAASPITPAPGNFMDLMDLVSSLDEDTQL